MGQVKEAASELQETESSLADHFSSKSLRNRILLKNHVAFQSQASDDERDRSTGKSDTSENATMESVKITRSNQRKKTSRIIVANHIQINLPGCPEDKVQPTIKITYAENAAKETPPSISDSKRNLATKLDQPSKFLKAKQKTKLMNSNLLQSLQSEEPASGQLFPSLQLKYIFALYPS